jgi:endoglucanase
MAFKILKYSKLSKAKNTLIISLFLTLWACKTPMIDENLPSDDSIRLNQIGFYPDQQKLAIIVGKQSPVEFSLWDKAQKETVYHGVTTSIDEKTLSGKSVSQADFSDFDVSGEYVLIVNQRGKSYPFQIGPSINNALAKASLKAFYFQRASTALEAEFAGEWSRVIAHRDDNVQIHPSAGSTNYPKGTIISAPFGWYDAGDYNKYIVNSGITVGTLLSLYEDYESFFLTQNLNIPESKNQIADILDEVRWNLDWMIAMQDPEDGGVYHKLTTAKFEGMVSPDLAISQRYVVAKSTSATLDFSAVMAQASRVYKFISPEKSIIYLKAAEKAWNWAIANPPIVYNQEELNATFDPDISTGAYGDQVLEDEWVWAASELYITSHNLRYWEHLKDADLNFQLPSWNEVSWLGFYSLLRHQQQLSQIPNEWLSTVKINLLQAARKLVTAECGNAFQVPMGSNSKDFIWGSNAVASNQGILLLYAYKFSSEHAFLNSAQHNLDYILGRNATGFSYVTGFGDKTPRHPHQRLAVSKPDLPPLPGFIVGGPNPGQQDKCEYLSAIPDESYSDTDCSYASNEIAINWNAPFAYLVNALEAIHQ